MPNALDNALDLYDKGLWVFPAKPKGRSPIVKWTTHKDVRPSREQVRAWFQENPTANCWVLTGVNAGYIVIDCDSPAGERWWRERLGDQIMDTTTQVRTARGVHFYFAIPSTFTGESIPSWAIHPEEGNQDPELVSFDFSADGRGVIAGGSIHETGITYEWQREWRYLQDAPESLLDGRYQPGFSVASETPRKPSRGVVRSQLSHLLTHLPAQGGRNEWLIRVAGHYAKTYRNQRDAFDLHVEQANNLLQSPLSKPELIKTANSAWNLEQQNNQGRSVDPESGFLVGDGQRLLTQVVERTATGRNLILGEYANFNVVANSVAVDNAGRRSYGVTLRRKEQPDIDIVIPGTLFGDEPGLRRFLASYGCTIMPPDEMYPKTGAPGVRLQRYIEAQNPDEVELVDAFGYYPHLFGDTGGFLTRTGLITENGPTDTNKSKLRPHSKLLANGMSATNYGFEHDENEARRVLREVLSFQDEVVASVYGAWWAACLIKPQIQTHTSLFPFVAIEAPSESGKTSGFFNLMNQLNGSTRGETQPTRAALRDMASSNRNGIIWIDDLDDPSYLMELLRAATANGSISKMDTDHASIKDLHIVAPIALSGEALGLGSQKALIDRAIQITAPSPTNRRSFHDPSKLQWDDVRALRAKYPSDKAGLTVLAGWYVKQALALANQAIDVLIKTEHGVGRTGDKYAILVAGAWLLDQLAGTDNEHQNRIDWWIQSQQANALSLPGENALTLSLLPWALREWQYPDRPALNQDKTRLNPFNPVFVRNYYENGDAPLDSGPLTVGFNIAGLAQAWERNKHGRVSQRTETADALTDQAKALKLKHTRIRVQGGKPHYFYLIEGELAHAVIGRALGKSHKNTN